ncbi:hypothetical protein [Mycobacterium marinum]|uniref:hypothetical protein n=1 Tax=Mycobacterium marinum TaxID=1781 RepID=UPI0035670EC1
MTFTPASDVIEVYSGPACWECGGPCATYKGSVHGWHCTACIERYLNAAAARAEAKQRKGRERLLNRMFHDNDSTPLTADRRRGGGGLRCVPRRRPGVDPTAATTHTRPLEGTHR